ncbi:MAG: hypothetical protein CVV42_15585 [Candidatus Riflebacteria bacterium HGW-Riflebacteria-2]|nr:MAG: hypothetical protein CVV42_15585 [Candidatus Riflebacteria bacterium HGW-Riflebacteria-2]
MQKFVLLRNLASGQRSGELPGGRSHFPNNDWGGGFISFVRPAPEFISENMVECPAVQTYGRSYISMNLSL